MGSIQVEVNKVPSLLKKKKKSQINLIGRTLKRNIEEQHMKKSANILKYFASERAEHN